jgi:putative ABC transport system substrate-binding protein
MASAFAEISKASRWKLSTLLFAACTMLATSALAQHPRSSVKTIGVLWSGTREGTAAYWGAFIDGMRELGWSEGKTAHFVMRFDDDDKTRLPKLAAELVRLDVDVLAVTEVATSAARIATTKIPIVALDCFDPVASGYTKSLSMPSGNVTGVTWQSSETAAKRVELARELVPGLKRLAMLHDPNDSGSAIELQSYAAAVAGTNVELRAFEVNHSRDFPAAFAAIKSYRPQALLYPTLVLTADNLEQTVRFARSLRIPTFTEAAQFAEEGILMSYGADYRDAFKRAAIQVDRVLNGAMPADLPWEQPTKFELVVNMKTAKALVLTVPKSILVRATRIIQ